MQPQAWMETWATHQPILAAFASHTSGAVLEMGTGFYSTPILHGICLGRRLVSLDSNSEFMEQFLPFRSALHEFHHVSDWDTMDDRLIEGPWGMAFVDHAPGLRRAVDIAALRSRAKFIVVHDTHPNAARELKLEAVLSSFKYRFDFTMWVPWTTVLSDVENPRSLMASW